MDHGHRLLHFRPQLPEAALAVVPILEPTISDGLRATWAEVDLGQLMSNFKAIRSCAPSAKAMLVVKANAYGHGLVEVARALESAADCIGVAVLEEGILLRQQGIQKPILVLGGIWGDQIPSFLEHDLMLTASSVGRLEQIDEIAKACGRRAKVHLKIDTGMERVGIHYYSAASLLEASLRLTHVDVEGIYSHFANADAETLDHARLQLERFQEVLAFYERRSLPTPTRHMANSAAILRLPQAHFDMVRPGILLYGIYPSEFVPRRVEVRSALTWKSRVVYFKVVEAGHPVSYGSRWQSDHPVRVVTLPVGYGDGYFRAMSNRAEVLLHGRRYPQIGTICMDQMMINLEQDSAFNGDEVILAGRDGEGRGIAFEELAAWAGTIPYEILTNINTRVPRVFR